VAKVRTVRDERSELDPARSDEMDGRRPSAGAVAEGSNVLGLLGRPGADRQLGVGRAHADLDNLACLADWSHRQTSHSTAKVSKAVLGPLSGRREERGSRGGMEGRTEIESHLDADLSSARLDDDVDRARPTRGDPEPLLKLGRRPTGEVEPSLLPRGRRRTEDVGRGVAGGKVEPLLVDVCVALRCGKTLRFEKSGRWIRERCRS
jgi:hypothetical protein